MITGSPAHSIEQFVFSVTPHVLASGQGYNTQHAEGVALDLAWYREDDYNWTLHLAVETAERRVETPADASFHCRPGFTRKQHEESLSQRLIVEYQAMLDLTG